MGVPTLELTGRRATISLDRPDKRNRIEPSDLVELVAIFERIEAAPDVRVVVLRAEGPSFCSGFHLGALAEGARTDVTFGDMCDRLAALRMPVIAQVEGNIHGGGTDLAISCDLRVAGEHIELLMPAARLGIQYYGTGLQRFVQRIGPSATKRLFLTALPVDAAHLLRIGYVDEVVPAAHVAGRVDAIATAIEALGPEAVQRTKAAIDQLAAGTTDLTAIEASARASLRSAEHREGIRALGEKRPADFPPSSLR